MVGPDLMSPGSPPLESHFVCRPTPFCGVTVTDADRLRKVARNLEISFSTPGDRRPRGVYGVSAMPITAVDVHLLDLPLTEPFVAGHGTTSSRTITVVEITTESGWGWGECSALPAATYTSESAADCFLVLAEQLVPVLLAGQAAAGGSVSAVEVRGLRHRFGERPMAISALEMALLDAELRADNRSLKRHLGVSGESVPAGVSIGLDTIESTVAKVTGMADEGYRRLKLKIQPGHDHQLVAAVRRALPTIELQVDANGAYGLSDVDHLAELVALGVDAVEQPFPPSDRSAAELLIARLGSVPVVADEAVSSQADAEALLAAGAMTGLSIKPARVGGLLSAVTLHDLCLERDIAATAGGMLETGLGRHALAALAGLPGFTLTGDLSPAGRWLAVDPWPDVEFADGRLRLHDDSGVAPEPDRLLLERVTVDHRRIVAP